MTDNNDWQTGLNAWAAFVKQHPELGYRPGKWGFHNFLRHFRDELVQADAIRLAKRRFWVAHAQRFECVGFACATGHAGLLTQQRSTADDRSGTPRQDAAGQATRAVGSALASGRLPTSRPPRSRQRH